jgi:hypothetical protein
LSLAKLQIDERLLERSGDADAKQFREGQSEGGPLPKLTGQQGWRLSPRQLLRQTKLK